MSWLGKLLGTDAAQEDIQKGIAQAGANTDRSIGAINTGGQQGQDTLRPLINGYRGSTAYANSTGANGVQAQNDAYAQWLQSNPAMAAYAQQQKQGGQQANARGGWGDAAAKLAASRVAGQNYQGWYQAPLQAQAQMENNAGYKSADLYNQTGMETANALAGNTAAVQGAYGNLAQTRTAIPNFLAQVAGLGLQGVNAYNTYQGNKLKFGTSGGTGGGGTT